MAGLLDFLTAGSYAANPLSGPAQGLLGALGPQILDFYKNQGAGTDVGGPQVNPMGNLTGFNNTPAPPQSAFPQGSDPMTAGGYPQSGPSSIATQPQPAAPIAIGGGQNPYMMPRMGGAADYAPQPGSTDISAQSRQMAPQGQPQMQQQPNLPPAFGQNPGNFLDKLNMGFQSIGNGGSVIGALTGTRTDPQSIAQQNLLSQYESLSKIVGPDKAKIAILNSEAGKALFKGEFENPKTVEGVYAGALQDSLNRSGGAGPKSTANPNDILTNALKYKQGVSQAEKSGQTIGEQQATAQMALPSAIAQSKEAMSVADRLLTHKGREGNAFFHGKASSYLGDALIPGNTDAFDANSLLSQLKGGAFLNAYATLRGGGQISNTEGAKAEQAILRANRAQSRDEFDSAIKDFKSSLRLAIDNASFRAGENPPHGFQGSQLGVGDTTTINGQTVRRIK